MSDDREQTLGEFLKAERQRRGLTIEQTASATKIGLKILRQLEADDYASLPALPFVRGFSRNYG
jgi:cytoskeletal protein RodZ